MSSNFPVVPVSVTLPPPPRDNNGLLGWAQSVSLGVRHLYRVLSSYLTDALGATGASLIVTSKLLSTSFSLPPNSGAYVPDELDIASGVTLEVGDGATLEVG